MEVLVVLDPINFNNHMYVRLYIAFDPINKLNYNFFLVLLLLSSIIFIFIFLF